MLVAAELAVQHAMSQNSLAQSGTTFGPADRAWTILQRASGDDLEPNAYRCVPRILRYLSETLAQVSKPELNHSGHESKNLRANTAANCADGLRQIKQTLECPLMSASSVPGRA